MRGRGVLVRCTALALCLSAIGVSGASAAAPTIVRTTVSSVSTDSASLGAEINPQGKETSYHFEYGPGDCSKTTCTPVPGPEGTIEAASSPVAVAAVPIDGLAPGTTYHLRIIASNADGISEGPDRIFATYAPALSGLPDGRAYEQASPVKKNAADARGLVPWAKASANGDAVAFLSTSGLPGGVGEQELPAYLASRGASGWSTQGLLLPASAGSEAGVRGWLPDFSAVFDFARDFSGGGGGSFLARSSADGTLREIVGSVASPNYAGASADGSQVLFETGTKLACCPAALAGQPNVYLWDRDSGQVSLISVLNDEKAPLEGASAGPYDWMRTPESALSATQGGSAANYYTQDLRAISADGKSVYFSAVGSGGLYVRLNPSAKQSPVDGEGKCTDPALACTQQVSATRRTPPDPLGSRPAAFMAATPDGQTAFFTSPEELTDEANTGPDQPPPSIASADVSVEPPLIEAAIPSIAAGGIAEDGKYIYWVNTLAKTIGRVEIGGANPEANFIAVPDLKVGPAGDEKNVAANPQYVAVDAGHIYWTNEGEGNNKEGTIGRADIDGSAASIEVKWIEGASRPKGIALNAEHLYWANASKNESPERAIARAGIGGGAVEPAFIKTFGTEFPEGVAVDASHIYWTFNDPNGSFGSLRRADLADGANEIIKFIGIGAELRGIAVDAGHVYWGSVGEEAIGRISLAGFEEPGICEAVASCENKFIETGRAKGVASDGTHLRWSVNGEAVPNPGNDLYRYRAADEELIDLTPDSDANGAEVKGVLGVAADGKRVYVAANGDLDGPGEAEAGDCRGRFAVSQLSFAGRCSLYLLQEGAGGAWSAEFIARLDAAGRAEQSDALNWVGSGNAEGQYEKSALVSDDGAALLFRSQARLGAYDNEGHPELYRFEVGAGEPRCISCNPTGEAPVGAPRLGSIGLSALYPAPPPAFVSARNLSADGGRVFFESSDRLAFGDENGKDGCELEGAAIFRNPSCQDVYEWEAQGTGSCKEDVQGGGCLYLLSTGTSPQASFFNDASLDGDNAFLATRSAGLVGQDQDQLQDVYDVRVGGGLASQSPSAPVGCEGLDGCHGAQSPPPGFQSPPSAQLGGPGNKKHVRHAKKHHKHKKHKKHHHKRGRAAGQTGGKQR